MTCLKRYWIVVASRDHAEYGVELGICQANHGKASPLKRMSVEDWVVVYSGKKIYGNPEPCMAFTAIGRVADSDVFQVVMDGGFEPYRRRVNYVSCSEAAIQPLIPSLTFIQNKTSWGYPFRFGMFEIKSEDFKLIASSMGAEIP